MSDQQHELRRLIAIWLLAAAALVSIGLAAATLYAVAWLPWPDTTAALRVRLIAHLGGLALAIDLVVVTAWAFVLGPMSWRFKAGRFVGSAEGGGADRAA